jgi:predicted  nucleic acid-binding Zn-ribbon protein
MPKTCKTCGNTKQWNHFNRQENSRKYRDTCIECETSKKAGLNPTPQVVDKVNIDADRQKRIKQYNMAKKRQQQGFE